MTRFPVCPLFHSGDVCGWCCMMQTWSFLSTQSVGRLQKGSGTFTLDFVKVERLIGQLEHTSGHGNRLFTSILKGEWDTSEFLCLEFIHLANLTRNLLLKWEDKTCSHREVNSPIRVEHSKVVYFSWLTQYCLIYSTFYVIDQQKISKHTHNGDDDILLLELVFLQHSGEGVLQQLTGLGHNPNCFISEGHLQSEKQRKFDF